jgi:hypothetical protein
MSFSYQEHWLVSGRVRLAIFEGNLALSDMLAADERVLSALEAADRPLYLILDMRQLKSFPSLNDSLKMRHIFHKNVGWYLTIGATGNPVARIFLSILMGLARIKYKDVRSLDEAWRFLHSIDAELPPTTPQVS